MFAQSNRAYRRVTMKRPSQFLLMLAGVAALTGCESISSQMSVTPVATEPDIVTVKLALAADKAAKALDVIASIDQQRAGVTPPVEDYSNVPPNLMQPVSLRWSGPVEQVVKALADRAGMRFRVKGAKPAAPLIVNVDVYQQPIMHVLSNIGLQTGRRADVAVDGAGGAIELRYAAGEQAEVQHADEIK